MIAVCEILTNIGSFVFFCRNIWSEVIPLQRTIPVFIQSIWALRIRWFFLSEWHFNTVAVVGCNTSLKFACIDSVFAAFLNPHYMVLVFRRGWSIWTKFSSFCCERYSRETTKYKLEILVSGVLPVNKYGRQQTRINTRENTARCGRVNGGNGSSSGWFWDVRIYHVTEG